MIPVVITRWEGPLWSHSTTIQKCLRPESRRKTAFSFAGFGSLLVLFFMLPCLALLAAEAFLLFLGILGWNRCAMAADILQILSGVLAVRIMVIDPEFFVGLAAFIVLMVLGIIGLLPPGRR